MKGGLDLDGVIARGSKWRMLGTLPQIRFNDHSTGRESMGLVPRESPISFGGRNLARRSYQQRGASRRFPSKIPASGRSLRFLADGSIHHALARALSSRRSS